MTGLSESAPILVPSSSWALRVAVLNPGNVKFGIGDPDLVLWIDWYIYIYIYIMSKNQPKKLGF